MLPEWIKSRILRYSNDAMITFKNITKMKKLKDNATVIEKIEFYRIRANRKIDDDMMVAIDEYLTDGGSLEYVNDYVKSKNITGDWKEEYFYNNLIDDESHTISIHVSDH